MPVRRVILLIVGVLVALLTAMTGVVAFGAWQHWTVARQHQIANEYSARLLNAAGMLAVERGLTYIALERPRPITAAERRRLDKTRIETDRAWEQALAVRTRTLRSLNRANDAIGPLDAKLGKFRRAADRALARPKGERSPGIATHWFSFVTGIIDEISYRYATLRTVTGEDQADEHLRRVLRLQTLAWLASKLAGRERALIAGAIAARAPPSPARIDEVTRLRSQLELVWEFIDKIAPQTAPTGLGGPRDDLDALVAAARGAFFGDLENARGIVDRGIRGGRDIPLSTERWWTVATTAIDRLLDIQQAVKVHVDRFLAAEVRSANGSLFGASLQFVLVLALGVFALIFVDRRINRPLRQLSLTLERYVRGDRNVAMPRFERNDEFGKLGKTFEAMMKAQRRWHEGLERIVEERTEDIRERERALRESETQLRLVTDNLPALISYIDRDRRYRFANKAYETWYGIPRAWIVGSRVADHVGAANYQAISLKINQALTGQTVRYALHFRFKDGRERDLDVTYVPHFGDDGMVQGLFFLITDITEHKQIEEALRASESRLAGILENAQDAIISVDEQARITLFNHGAEESFGYDAGEVIGKALDMLMPSHFHERHRRHFKKFIESGVAAKSIKERAPIVGLRKDGSEFPAEASISKLNLPEGVVFTIMLSDITRRVRADMEAKARARQQEVVATLGQRALADDDFPALLDHAVRQIAETLETEYCKVLELPPDGETLILRAGVGWRDGLVGKATVDAGANSQAGFTLASGAPVLVEDLRTETRFTGLPLPRDPGGVGGVRDRKSGV